MRYVAIAIGIAAGLVLGVLGGLRAGAWSRGNAARYWSLNSAAFLGSLGLDIVGLIVRQQWLSYGSLGLMAGLITGLKYGHSPTLRVWEAPEPPADPPAGEPADPALEPAADAPTADAPAEDDG